MNAISTSQILEIMQPLEPIPGETAATRHVFVLQNRRGLHCRPAAFLVNTIQNLACEVTVEGNGAVVNGKCISLPYDCYERWGIRRFGFHGLSHAYCAERASEMLNRPIEDQKLK